MAKQIDSAPITPFDDGLHIPEVGPWAEEKYRLVQYYDEIFTTGMKNRWGGRLVYIDLFSGAGYARIENQQKIVAGSPLLALGVPDPFEKYIFVDEDPRCCAALTERAKRHRPDADVKIINGDCHRVISEVVREVRKSVPGRNYLSFCFVDPYNMQLEFPMIRSLSEACGKIDFLVLLALRMDAKRNEQVYTDPDNTRIDDLLDDKDWRVDWANEHKGSGHFGRFVADKFTSRMMGLGYLPAPKSQWKEVRTSAGGPPLYHLVFFSKHPRGYDFWKKVLKHGAGQKSLDLDL